MSKYLLIISLILLTACGSIHLCNTAAKTGPTACPANVTHAPTRQNESRTSVQATSVLVTAETAQIATPDALATQTALLNSVATANAQTYILQQQLTDAKNENEAISARKAEAEAATARDKLALEKEQNRAPVEAENAKRLRVEAENKRLELAADLARAETDREQGVAKTAALLSFCAVMIGVILLMYRAMTRPHVSYKVTRPDFSHAQGDTTVWTARECPPGVTEEQMIVIAHGRQSGRNATGPPLSRRNWLHVLTRDRWDGMIDYLIDNEYATQSHANAPITITPKGDEYFYQFEQLAPLPQPSASPTA